MIPRIPGLLLCAVLALGALPKPAFGAIIYADDRLIDTTSGLIWTHGEIPTATFVATGGWTIATTTQLLDLIEQVAPSPGPYSASAAALTAWSQPFGYIYAADWFSEGALCHGPAGSGNCFAGLGLFYQPDENGIWSITYISTASLYGPTFSSMLAWDTDHVTAFLVTPVPLPPGFWLLLSGLIALVVFARHRVVLRGDNTMRLHGVVASAD